MATIRPWWAWAAACALALAATALSGLVTSERRRAEPAPPPEGNAMDLARRIAPALGLRVVPTSRSGSSDHGAFLTRARLSWEELNGLLKSPEHLANWAGTLYCERSSRAGQDLRQWEGCSLTAGPFVFFGDPDLLGQIPGALAQTDSDRRR